MLKSIEFNPETFAAYLMALEDKIEALRQRDGI
jgi:hypothetical protein